MANQILLATTVLVIVSQSVFALNCYKCNSKEPNRTCVDPIDVNAVQSISCTNQNTQIISRFFGSDSGMEENLIRAAEETTEFECLVFERFYKDSQINETVRDCFPKVPNVSVCEYLKFASTLPPQYDVKKCESCSTNNCNVHEGNSAASLHNSAFLCILLVLVRISFN